ncbi:MAG: GPR endopeptidase [Firmicutes bacterium]|nr:GPR endopeptidase [Bacillota bacterium]
MREEQNVHQDRYRQIEQDFENRYGVRTDLAIEAHEVIVRKEGPPELPGVIVKNEETEHALISRVTVENELGAKMIGKRPGNYSTIEAKVLREHNREIHEDIGALLAKEIEWFLDQSGLNEDDPVLIVGLGNWNATPDALGPQVVGNLMVTRHLLELSPPELRKGLRPVAAIAPGVLGLTGIETGEIVTGVVERIGAKAVICIDALASRSVDRLCSTIQISDTGINPGAGVGNKRIPINEETLGIPVIAIGVPTVVHASTIVSDALDLLSGSNPHDNPRNQDVPQRTSINPDPSMIMGGAQGTQQPQFNSIQKQQMINQVLEPFFGTMIVTPKDIDQLIEDVTQVIAGGLNAAFHEGVDYTEIFQYLS